MTSKFWTTSELAILREIAASPLSTSAQLNRLPGRTMDSIRRAIARHGLKKATWTQALAEEAVLGLLKKRDLFVGEIAARLSLSRQWVGRIVRSLRKRGRVHLAARVLTATHNRTLLWRYGPGVDAPPVSRRENKLSVAPKPQPEPTVVQARRDEFTSFFFGSMEAA
jgi:DNA-binding MarR family transcriptional regulator